MDRVRDRLVDERSYPLGYTYKCHTSVVYSEDHDRSYLWDYPLEWFPCISRINQEITGSIVAGSEIYDPLHELSHDELVKDIRTSKYPDYELMLLTEEITDGKGPSFIEIRTAADNLNKVEQEVKSPWDVVYWSNYFSSKICGKPVERTNKIMTLINWVKTPPQSPLFPIFTDQSRTTISMIIKMHQECIDNPENKLDIVDDYRQSIKMPRIILWFMIKNLDELHKFYSKSGELNQALFRKSALNLLQYVKVTVENLENLINSYRKAYPEGYFKPRAKSARSAK